MANSLYDKAREAFITGGINLLTDDIKVILVDDDGYTFSEGHQYVSEVPVAARVQVSAPLEDKSALNGVFDAADVTFEELVGPSIEAVILYKDTGVESSSPLILWIDEGNLPIVPNGGDVTLKWSDGPNRIFRI